MPSAIRSVTVYCSSSSAIAPAYLQAGAALGAAIARSGWTLVYGGNFMGLMAAVAQAAREAGGRVVGITPRRLHEQGHSDAGCDELIVTETMRQRKHLLEERGDALLALPGGLGTLEELFEVIVGRQLGFHAKPIVILNVARYYDPLLAMLEHGIEHRFIKPGARRLWFVAQAVDEAVQYLKDWTPAAAADAAVQPPALAGAEAVTNRQMPSGLE